MRGAHEIIQQGVSRPGIAGHQVPVGRDPSDVGDAADVDDHDRAGQAALGDERAMIDRHQRRPLPAGGDIGGAEIEDHRQAEPLRQRRAVADLHRQPPLGCMEHGLAMEADEIDGRAGVFLPQPLDNLAMGRGDHRLGLGERARPGVSVGQRPGVGERPAEHGALILAVGPEEARAETGDRLAVRFQQRRVDAVHGGAAHQSENIHCFAAGPRILA